jgi:hypothetical protein
MASTYSIRFRLNYQAPGDNLNAWGGILNVGVFQLLEDAMAKRVAFVLSGTKILTTANGAADEARSGFLDAISGTGGTVIIPSVEKIYLARNAASGNMIVTTGSGVTATFYPGEISFCVCDAVNVRKLLPADFGGSRISDLSDPVNPQDAATKAYADALAFTANAGILPAQPGNSGKFLKTVSSVASWQSVMTTDIPDYANQTASTAAAMAIAFGRGR